MAAFQQLAAHFIHATGQQLAFRSPLRFREVSLGHAVLNFERVAPFLQTNQEIPLPRESRQVIRFDSEDLLQRLERLLISLCSFEVFRQLEKNLDIPVVDRKSTRLNSSHGYISYAVFCL